MSKIINYLLRVVPKYRRMDKQLSLIKEENEILVGGLSRSRDSCNDLEKRLEVQIGGVRNLKFLLKGERIKSGELSRKLEDAVESYVKDIKKSIDAGYNPLKGEFGGNYAFISGGRVTALSESARKILRCGDDYSAVLTEKFLNKIEEGSSCLYSNVFVGVSIWKKLRRVRLKEVQVEQLDVGGDVVGYFVDFENVERIEKLRDLMNKKSKKHSNNVIKYSAELLKQFIERNKNSKKSRGSASDSRRNLENDFLTDENCAGDPHVSSE